MLSFGDLIKRKREHKQLSINALSKNAGVDPSYIMRLEKGTNKQPSFVIAMKLAKELDISLKEISDAFGVEALSNINIEGFCDEDSLENIAIKDNIKQIFNVINNMKNESNTSIEDIISLLTIVDKITRKSRHAYIAISDSESYNIQLDYNDFKIDKFIRHNLNEMRYTEVIHVEGEILEGSVYTFEEFLDYILNNEIIEQDERDIIIDYYNKNK